MKKIHLTKELDSNEFIMQYLGYKKISSSKFIFPKYTLVNYELKEGHKVNEEDQKHMIRSTIPFFFITILLVIAFILATTFLILNFTYLNESNKLDFFFMLMVPAFFFILGATALSLIRYFITYHNLETVAYIMSKVKKEKNNNE